MHTQRSARSFSKALAPLAAYALVVAANIAGFHVASAYETAMPAAPLETSSGYTSLEQAFWNCDYVATTRGVGAVPMAACSAIYTELKNQKFGGDFAEMLGWWRENKVVEHRRLEARE